jgi:hypothetical protein
MSLERANQQARELVQHSNIMVELADIKRKIELIPTKLELYLSCFAICLAILVAEMVSWLFGKL